MATLTLPAFNSSYHQVPMFPKDAWGGIWLDLIWDMKFFWKMRPVGHRKTCLIMDWQQTAFNHLKQLPEI